MLFLLILLHSLKHLKICALFIFFIIFDNYLTIILLFLMYSFKNIKRKLPSQKGGIPNKRGRCLLTPLVWSLCCKTLAGQGKNDLRWLENNRFFWVLPKSPTSPRPNLCANGKQYNVFLLMWESVSLEFEMLSIIHCFFFLEVCIKKKNCFSAGSAFGSWVGSVETACSSWDFNWGRSAKCFHGWYNLHLGWGTGFVLNGPP